MADPRLARPLWRGRTNVDAFTIACIEHAEQIVRDEAPKIAHQFDVTQGSYQGDSGDPDSGTTHRLGGGVDLGYCGHAICYSALRRAGMFIWHRDPSQGDWKDHFHGAPIGHPFMDFRLAAQETSYFAGGDGIGGRDTGPRFTPIPQPVWPYPPEDDVTPEDIEKVAAAVLARPMKVKRDGKAVTIPVEQVLRETFQRAERVDEDAIANRVLTKIQMIPPGTMDTDSIKAAVLDAFRQGTG